MAIKLIAMDLDGTLLNSAKQVSPGNLAAIEAAKAKGVGVTIATGRMYNSAEYFGRIIGANVPLVCCCGGLVQAIASEVPVFARYYEPAFVRAFLDFCLARDWYLQWYIGKGIFAGDYRPEYFAVYRTVQGFAVHEVGRDYPAYTEKVLQFVVRDLTGQLPAILRELEQAFPGKFVATMNVATNADLLPPGIDKAAGVAALMRHLGLTPDEVMCCGDAENDLSMLRFAGTSVVPANGQPAAQALATYHAPSCDEDAIARAIEDLVL